MSSWFGVWCLAVGLLTPGCTFLTEHRLEPAQAGEPDGAVQQDADTPLDGAADGGRGDGTEADAALVDTGSMDAAGHDAAEGTSADGAIDASALTAKEGQLCVGTQHACVVNAAGRVVCWGALTDEQDRLPTGRSYGSVACGGHHTCALDTEGNLACAGRNLEGQRVVQNGPFAEVAAGGKHTCVLDMDGIATCWGANDGGQASPPNQALHQLVAGDSVTCALSVSDDTVLCWGLGAKELADQANAERFTSITLGDDYLCGIAQGDFAKCVGPSTTPPLQQGSTLKLSAGATHACALSRGGDVRCQTHGRPVEAPFADHAPLSDLAAGGGARCAVRQRDRFIVCDPPETSVGTGPGVVD